MSADDLEAVDWAVRHDIYRRFMHEARPPTPAETAGELGVSVAEVERSRHRLEAAHVLALKPGSAQVWMAHPFSAEPTGYRVISDRQSWWGNCAWDALAIPPLVGEDARIEAACPDCGYAFDLSVSGGQLVGADTSAVVHLVVPPSQFWDDVGFT